jgi:hypothetical protein
MNTKFLLVFLAIVIVMSIIARLLPHAPNFTPIAALALFAGVYASRMSKWYLITPLVAMAVSDLFVGLYEPKTMAVVYASFFAIALFGLLVRMDEAGLHPSRVYRVGLATLIGSILFFITTNFAVWAFSGMYEHTMAGLMLSYSMAIPFLKFTILGDVFYVAVFFGSYEFITNVAFKYRYGQPTATATAKASSN